MNDNDLERDLRSQRGPREGGYTPTVLPVTLDKAPAPGSTPSRVGRAGLFVGVGLAGAAAVAVIAGILSGPGSGPEVGSGNSTEPSAVATSQPETPCGIRDVALTTEAWGGAAGSRGTVLTISLTPNRYPCLLPRSVQARVVDGRGHVVVEGSTPEFTGTVPLQQGMSYEVGISWSNWCGTEPEAPLSLRVAVGAETPTFVGVGRDLEAGAVPPCLGNDASTLSLTDVQARE